jgi:hypothetical protein
MKKTNVVPVRRTYVGSVDNSGDYHIDLLQGPEVAGSGNSESSRKFLGDGGMSRTPDPDLRLWRWGCKAIDTCQDPSSSK